MEQYRKASEMVMRIGMQFGIALILFNIIRFYFRLDGISVPFSSLLWIITVVLYSVVIIYTIRKIRDDVFDGVMKYATALSYGTGVIFFAAGASALASYIYFQWADPFFLAWRSTTIIEMVINFYQKNGVPEELMQMLNDVKEQQVIPKPFGGAFNQFISNVSLSFFITLIAAAFLKKEARKTII